MRTRIAASRSIDVIVLIQPSNYFCDFSSKIHALKDKKKNFIRNFYKNLLTREKTSIDFRRNIRQIHDFSRVNGTHIPAYIFLLGCDSRTWNDNPQTVLPSHATNAIHLGQSTSRSIEISNRGSAWRTFLSRSFFFSFSPLSQARRKSETGRMAGGSGGRERERGGEEELISYREASRKRRRGARGLSEKKERVKNTFARDFLWVEGRGGGRTLHVWMKLFRWRRGTSGRRRKLIRRKAVPGGISFEFSEHRGNSVSVLFFFFFFIFFSHLVSWIHSFCIDGYFFFCFLSGKEFDFFFFFYELPSGEYREISERRGYTYTSEIYVGTWKNFGIIVLVVINKYKLNRMIMFHPLEMDVWKLMVYREKNDENLV